MDAKQFPSIILAIFSFATAHTHAQDLAEPAKDCATSLVQVDDKGILSTSAQCRLSDQTAKAIENSLFQIRHDLKPSFDEMRVLLAANNIILGAVLDRLIAGDMNLDGVMKISQLLANKGKADPSINLMTEATQWKEHYEALMESLKAVNETDSGDTNAVQALQSLDLDSAAGLLDDRISTRGDKETANARPYFLRAEIFLLQFQPQNALPLLEKARQLQPDNQEYGFAYAKALQEQNLQGSAESLYTTLLNQYRVLAKDNPTAYLPSIAATLNNLGMLYSESKRTNEAENAYRETLEIRRNQTKDGTATNRAAVALVLNNLANLYFDNQRMGEAEKAYREALEIRRTLAKEDPAVYLRSVAATLNNLGNIYRSTKRPDEAEKAYREALETTHTVAKDNPAAYRQDLAATLNNLGNVYSEAKRPQEAEKVWGEARDIQRELARGEPSAYQPSLARTLNNLGNLYSEAKRMVEAEKAYREALEIRTALAKDSPDTYQSQVAATLNNLGLMYRDNQHFSEAEKTYGEALSIQRELYRADPESNAANLKTMLSGAAVLMEKMGRQQERATFEAERASIK